MEVREEVEPLRTPLAACFSILSNGQISLHALPFG